MRRKLETRYAYLHRDAKILTASLELAAQRLLQLVRGVHADVVVAEHTYSGAKYTASDVRELSSELSRIVWSRGRGKGAAQR